MELFNAMGTTGVTDSDSTWLLGMSSQGELLPPTHLAIIRLYWRHVYAAMTRLKLDKEPFSTPLVQRSIARTFYSRLLAYQHSLTLKFYRRRYSSTGNYTVTASVCCQAVLTNWFHSLG
eukprot:6213263-Pleurochrysis_carterae.AAC.3